jgi:hypothetical protein
LFTRFFVPTHSLFPGWLLKSSVSHFRGSVHHSLPAAEANNIQQRWKQAQVCCRGSSTDHLVASVLRRSAAMVSPPDG